MKASYLKPRSLLDNISTDSSPGGFLDLLKKTDSKKMDLTTRVQSRTFNMSDEKDSKDYNSLLTDGSNKKVSIAFLSRQWKEDKSGIMIYVEWADFSATYTERT